ncbi:transposase, IS481 family [Bordetella pertussis STO1-CHOC-0019]|nr:transposase, IS481 family [Bordetella pertussis STO1-CHOC-0019]
MNTHKHARLTFLRRLEMVQQLIAHQVCVPEAARAYGVTAPTVRKWLGRFLAQGQAGLADASSRPTVSPRAIAPAKALAIVELRRKRLTQARIAQALGVSASPVSRVLARAGLSHLATWSGRGPGRAGGALRASGPRRSAAHRHQEAGTYPAPWPGHGHIPLRGRLGLRLRGHR